MKRIAVTQRVDTVSSHEERRDALDQRWIPFLQTINLLSILVPNNITYVQQLIEENFIDGILLTGGNSLVKYGGDAPERDEVEKLLIGFAYSKDLPLLGVCRGMQMIQEYFNNSLCEVDGHVASRHSLIVNEGLRMSSFVKRFKDVNAFHEYGTYKVEGDLLKVAKSHDDVVMAIEHKEKNIFGVMWHSERELSFNKNDQDMFKEIFWGDK
ncbi:gamma-glutamyl-gamma-aminobutyrate hydrolase family protein [Alphaproteobacteria bacterium]|nr:gamma-glutamyl-gamma-aminobutyrate hydrolase family protein [Alphaproteobacteria bacterium]MDC1023087.1 gamma-glutamyl-gamma-aminobutyrate hydrolase family protein [Alphaproteobacteria bacterium]